MSQNKAPELIAFGIGAFFLAVILYHTWHLIILALALIGAWHLFQQNNRRPPGCR